MRGTWMTMAVAVLLCFGDAGRAQATRPASTQPATQPATQPSDLKTSFYGTGGNARTVVYVIDASGSLIDTLDFVKLELARSITELSDKQSFTVIFFQGEEALEPPNWTGPCQATQANKKEVFAWMPHIVPGGIATPLLALRKALAYKPDLVYLLSDNAIGKEAEANKLLGVIREANTGGTKINTIQFFYPDKLSEKGLEPTLKRISDENGGTYKFVGLKEMGIE